MKVSLSVFKALQEVVYEGNFIEDLIPVYHEFADFSGTDFTSPDYARLVEGLINLQVE